MFNDTSWYLDDIFTIDNPDFEKHIPDIYPAEVQLNKANTSDKETSFLDLNIKVNTTDADSSWAPGLTSGLRGSVGVHRGALLLVPRWKCISSLVFYNEVVTFIQAFTTNAMTSDFLLLISHGWVVTFNDSHRTVFIFRSWFDLLGVVLAFWISILKISKLLQSANTGI